MKHPAPQRLVLRGAALFLEQEDFSALVELPSLWSVIFADLLLEEDPNFVPYTEEAYAYMLQMERRSYDASGVKISLLQKLLLNREYASTFVFHQDGSVTTEDGRILVHILEVCHWELASEVRILGKCLCSGYTGDCSFAFYDQVEHIGQFAFASCRGEGYQSPFPVDSRA